MGHINEPKGIDFLIQSPPLTDRERKELSEFIQKCKSEGAKTKNTNRKLKVKPKTKA